MSLENNCHKCNSTEDLALIDWVDIHKQRNTLIESVSTWKSFIAECISAYRDMSIPEYRLGMFQNIRDARNNLNNMRVILRIHRQRHPFLKESELKDLLDGALKK